MKVHRKVRSEWCRKLDFEETNQSKGMRQENFSQKKNQNVKMTKRSTICLEQKHSTVKTTCRRSPVLCQNDHPFFRKSSQFLAFNYLVLTCRRSAVNAKMTLPSKKKLQFWGSIILCKAAGKNHFQDDDKEEEEEKVTKEDVSNWPMPAIWK